MGGVVWLCVQEGPCPVSASPHSPIWEAHGEGAVREDRLHHDRTHSAFNYFSKVLTLSSIWCTVHLFSVICKRWSNLCILSFLRVFGPLCSFSVFGYHVVSVLWWSQETLWILQKIWLFLILACALCSSVLSLCSDRGKAPPPSLFWKISYVPVGRRMGRGK